MSIGEELGSRLPQRARHNPFVRVLARVAVLGGLRDAARANPRAAWHYLLHSRETSNFSYEIENLDELAAVAAEVLGPDRGRVEELIAELRNDRPLLAELGEALSGHPGRDDAVRIGYRYATYAAARIVRPRLIAEVGTHDGLQAAFLLRALERNEAEGHAGELVSYDNVETAGWLVPERLRSRHRIVCGDVLETFEDGLGDGRLELLIQDVSGSWPGVRDLYERALAAAPGHLAIFGEVGEVDALRELALAAGGQYGEFRERPVEHFWPGDNRGLAAIPGSS